MLHFSQNFIYLFIFTIKVDSCKPHAFNVKLQQLDLTSDSFLGFFFVFVFN